jgi:hypothetical protein
MSRSQDVTWLWAPEFPEPVTQGRGKRRLLTWNKETEGFISGRNICNSHNDNQTYRPMGEISLNK